MSYWTDPPEQGAEYLANDQDAWLNRRPVCCKCKDHIQDEDGYEIDGELYCDDCAHDWLDDHKVSIDNRIIWG